VKIKFAMLLVCLLSTSFAHGNSAFPPITTFTPYDPNAAQKALALIIANMQAMDKLAASEGADKDGSIAAAKAVMQKTIEHLIQTQYAPSLKELVVQQEAALVKQLNDATNQADKDKIQDQLKHYKTLRERYLQAAVDTEMLAAQKAKSSRISTLLAGIFITLAFASAGLMYARR